MNECTCNCMAKVHAYKANTCNPKRYDEKAPQLHVSMTTSGHRETTATEFKAQVPTTCNLRFWFVRSRIRCSMH